MTDIKTYEPSLHISEYCRDVETGQPDNETVYIVKYQSTNIIPVQGMSRQIT
jgi:hypothetical protein